MRHIDALLKLGPGHGPCSLAQFGLRLVLAVSGRVRRLVARAVVAGVDAVALEVRDLEVDATELDYVAHSDHLLLVVGEKVFKYLVDGAFLPDDQPHRPA